MATTKDLSELIDRVMGVGQGPFLVRICQDAGLLPKAKRGGWRSMAQLTPDHVADFIIAVAGTRASGKRNANGAKRAIEMFASLVTDWEDWENNRGKRTLREDISFLLSTNRYELETDEGVYAPMYILFIDDNVNPWVELRLASPAGFHSFLAYTTPGNLVEDAGPVASSAIILIRLLIALEEMLSYGREAPAPDPALRADDGRHNQPAIEPDNTDGEVA